MGTVTLIGPRAAARDASALSLEFAEADGEQVSRNNAKKGPETAWAESLTDKCVTCPLMAAGLCGAFQKEVANGADPQKLGTAVAKQLETRSLKITAANHDEARQIAQANAGLNLETHEIGGGATG